MKRLLPFLLASCVNIQPIPEAQDTASVAAKMVVDVVVNIRGKVCDDIYEALKEQAFLRGAKSTGAFSAKIDDVEMEYVCMESCDKPNRAILFSGGEGFEGAVQFNCKP